MTLRQPRPASLTWRVTADDALKNLQLVLNALVLNALSNAAGQLAVGARAACIITRIFSWCR
jgi:hypothetical protein